MTEASLETLEERVLAADKIGDQEQLAGLYKDLAQRLDAQGDVDAACFFMTQAYVLALAVGSPEAARTWRFLRDHGRESGEFRPP